MSPRLATTPVTDPASAIGIDRKRIRGWQPLRGTDPKMDKIVQAGATAAHRGR